MSAFKFIKATKKEKIVYLSCAVSVALALILVPVFMYVYYLNTRPYMDTVESVRVESSDCEIESGLSGDDLRTAIDEVASAMTVTAVYESGKEITVAESSYTVSYDIPDDEVTALGSAYNIKVSLNIDDPVSCTFPVYVTKAQAENGTIVGAQAAEEAGVTRVGGFTTLTENADDHYVEVSVNSQFSGAARLMVRVSNGNVKGGTGGDDVTWAPPLPLDEIAKLYVNGEEITISSDAIVPAGELLSGTMYANFFNTYYTVDLGEVTLIEGENIIKLCLVDSGNSAYYNLWGEPSCVNIDYFRLLPVENIGNKAQSITVAGASGEVSVSANRPFKDALFDALGDYCIAVVYRDGNVCFFGQDSEDLVVTVEFALEYEEGVEIGDTTQSGYSYILTVSLSSEPSCSTSVYIVA